VESLFIFVYNKVDTLLIDSQTKNFGRKLEFFWYLQLRLKKCHQTTTSTREPFFSNQSTA
jgi:hypothetical protein